MSVDYLVPILVNFKEKKIICMFDYKNSGVYYLQDNNLSEEEKSKLNTLIINKIESKAIVDVDQPEMLSVGALIKNLNINEIRNKYSSEAQEENV